TKILGCVLPVDCQRVPDPNTGGDADDLGGVPRATRLHQNAPNPFNPTTEIRFDLARDGRVALRIYDVAGRRVRTLVDGQMPPGFHASAWDGLDEAGRRVSSGVYFYRLEAGDVTATRKLVVMK
ncbi:MAG: FlgD immunoglobulin-like domain containing protein, partial [Candidatus Krumholzibacteriia bacterium]